MRFTLLTLLFAAFTLSLTAQQGSSIANRMGENAGRGPSLAKVEEKADQALRDGDDFLAMDYYARVIAADSNKVSALFGYAQAAFEHSAFIPARIAVTKVLALEPNHEKAKMLEAEIFFREGNYEAAQEKYSAFLASDSPALRELGEKGLESASYAIVRRDNSDFSKTAILLDTAVNTEYSEYMNWPNNDGTFYFSSYRFPFKNEKGSRQRQRYQVKVMTATPNGVDFSAAEGDFNEEKRHTLHPTFNDAGTVMYYAEGDFINSADIRCELYMRRKSGDSWGPAAKLGPSVNVPGFTATEPNVGRMPGSDQETLFFVSDRADGKGGRDIWYAPILGDGAIGAVTNLAAINTPGDDVTPFYHNATGTLYFSTNSRQSMGGFDVYKTVGNGSTWSEPFNLEPPVNSPANDVFFTLNEPANIAYLSSNRFGSANISEEACCYDIFQVPLVKPKMLAVTFNKATNDTLPYTTIRLYEIVDGKRILVDSAKNIPLGYHPFSVGLNKKYVVVGERTGFLPDTSAFETPRLAWDNVLKQHLYLEPLKVDLLVHVFDKVSNDPLSGTTCRFVDLGPGGKNNGPAGSIGSAQVVPNDKNNEYYFPLEFEHTYMVYVSKNGYTTDSAFVSTVGLKESKTLNADLYLQRGIGLEAFVFDNTSRNPVPINGVRFDLYEIPKNGEPIKITSDIRTLDNKFTGLLEYDKRYRIVATKPGYSTGSVDFKVPQLTDKPFEIIHQDLYIHSLDLEKYLPIRLYFDNDEPNRRTMATTTEKLYSQTYFGYYPKKDTFIYEYTKTLSDIAAKKRDSIALEIFFEDSLKGEWNRLRFFTEVLFDKLKAGDQVNIQIKGFASPRAPSGYNQNLTSRRIISVMNHFSDFDGELLKKYIETKQLVVVEVPNGESKSRPGVNDDYFDPRNSVFSPEASKERRVEIVGIDISSSSSR